MLPQLAIAAAFFLVAVPAPPRITYNLAYIPAPVPEWRVTLEAINLPTTGIALELSDFGSWTDLADYYLTRLTADPPVAPDPTNPARWLVNAPGDWDGSLHVEYALHAAAEGTAAQQAHALLPVRTSAYTYGCTLNTLMNLLADGTARRGQRTVTITPPEGWQVFSGWGGDSERPQTFDLQPNDRNGLIVMGAVTSRADVIADNIPIQVRQFGAGPPSADKVAGWLARAAPLMTATTGADPGPLRVFLTDSAGGGMMTDRGLMVGIRASWSPEDVDLFSTRHTVCHELFHAWLGGMLRPSGDMIWFLEGFTDYISLWHAAAAGVVPHDWFVKRLGEFGERARQSSLGTISFIDEGVQWRDGDGPNETMAYAGAHTVAFAIDVELRRRGQALGVLKLIADLLRADGRPCTRTAIREWFIANDAADLWDEYIAGKRVPDVRSLLRDIGCEPGFEPVKLTYLGARAEPENPAEPRRSLHIVELDLASPIARAGAKVGDVITGWFPFRSEAIEISPDVSTRFTFGLTSFVPGHPGAYIGVAREGSELKLDIAPEVIPGGRRERLVPGARFHEFFDRDVR